MDIAGVREALHKQPLEPFLIKLANGGALPVPHRDFLADSPRRIDVVAEGVAWSVVEPLLIVSLDSMPKKPKGGNGSGRKKPKS